MNYRESHSHIYNFTLIELLIVIAIIAILAAMLFPALNQAREKSYSINCLSNTKQTAMGINLYMNDYDSYFYNGISSTWGDKLDKLGYLSIKSNVMFCPKSLQHGSTPNHHYFTYSARYFNGPGYAYSMKKPMKDGKTSNLLLVADGAVREADGRLLATFRLHEDNVGYGQFYLIHGTTGNAAFLDGHSEALRELGRIQEILLPFQDGKTYSRIKYLWTAQGIRKEVPELNY